ncbi:MAG: diacylglycerol kinase family protein [Parcubacteria group bacterium]
MKNTEIGVIINPHAGPSRGRKEFNSVQALACREMVPLFTTKDIDEIPDVLRKLLIAQKVKIVLVYGGDGTLREVVDFAIYKKSHETEKAKKIGKIPLIGSIGGGTQQAVHNWLGLEGSPSHLLKKILATPYEYLPTRKLKPLEISFVDESGRKKIHWGFIFIMGLAEIIEVYEKERSVLNGVKHFALAALASVTGLPLKYYRLVRQFNASLYANDNLLSIRKPIAIVCSVTDHLLYGIQPFHGRREFNQFYAASYQLSARSLVAMLPLIYRGAWIPGARLIPPYSLPHQVAPSITPVFNHRFFSKALPGADNFFNQPVFNFSVVSPEKNQIFIDGELYKTELGSIISVKLGPDVQFVSAFGS